MCIPWGKVCNSQPDCPNGEDESVVLCHINECANNNGNCSHVCIDLPMYYRCDCRAGYKLGADNRTCEGKPIIMFPFILLYYTLGIKI